MHELIGMKMMCMIDGLDKLWWSSFTVCFTRLYYCKKLVLIHENKDDPVLLPSMLPSIRFDNSKPSKSYLRAFQHPVGHKS